MINGKEVFINKQKNDFSDGGESEHRMVILSWTLKKKVRIGGPRVEMGFL